MLALLLAIILTRCVAIDPGLSAAYQRAAIAWGALPGKVYAVKWCDSGLEVMPCYEMTLGGYWGYYADGVITIANEVPSSMNTAYDEPRGRPRPRVEPRG